MTEALPTVVIQAGGKGERMRAGGLANPKVLITVHGVSLIERLLRQVAAEGAREIFVITGHAAEQVEAHVLAMGDMDASVKIRIIRERVPRGNVGALSELAGIDRPILFAFGDLLTNLSFQSLYRIHQERRAAITAASHFERHRLQLGHLIAEGDRVVDYREKPEYEFLICSGIMAIEPQVLSLLPKEGALGMNRLVMLAVESGLPVTHWTHNSAWVDVNTPELLRSANAMDWSIDSHARS